MLHNVGSESGFHRRTSFYAGTALFFAVALTMRPPLADSSASAAPAKAPAAHPARAAHSAPPAPSHHITPASSISHERNPHLHGFHTEHLPLAVHGVHPAVLHVPEEHRHLYEVHGIEHHWWTHHWYYSGNYTVWLQEHTGLGVIEGTVVSANNVAIPNAQVWLRKPHGRNFRRASMKHITHTDSFGNFKMLGVHPGNYRVMAKGAPGQSHIQTHVNPGVVERTLLRL